MALKNWHFIMKKYLYNFDHLKPHFYIVKLVFTGVDIICLISAQNLGCGYSSELPCWGSSNEYTQYMFWVEIWKILIPWQLLTRQLLTRQLPTRQLLTGQLPTTLMVNRTVAHNTFFSWFYFYFESLLFILSRLYFMGTIFPSKYYVAVDQLISTN